MTLEVDPELRMRMQQANSLIVALWDPGQKTQLSCVQAPDTQKLWDRDGIV